MSINIEYLGHSAFIIKNDSYSVIIDPFLTGNPKASITADKVQVSDILVTHGHGDHVGDAVEISKKTGTKITAVFEIANYCTKKGAKSQGINLGGKIKFPWGWAVWLPASHTSSFSDGSYAGCPASILLEIGGVKIYHAGDTGLHMDLKMIGDVYKPDVSILPIGGYYTMGIDEAVIAAKWIGSQTIIPMHYDTFPPIKTDASVFKEKIESQMDARCIILPAGENLII